MGALAWEQCAVSAAWEGTQHPPHSCWYADADPIQSVLCGVKERG